MPEAIKTNVLVLGGGPGGYVAAIRCGQLGLDTMLVEGARLGGTCLIRGCIPSKALIHAASEYAVLTRARSGANPLGLRIDGQVSVDLSATVRWKDGIVDRLADGVAALLRRAKVRVEAGWGTFLDAKTCEVRDASGAVRTITADHVILAAGSEAVPLPGLNWSADVLSSTEALDLKALPERLAVIGAGYIGLELGMAFRKLGSAVTVIEAQDRILPQYDEALTAPVAKALAGDGIDLHLNTKAKSHARGRLTLEGPDGAQAEIAADKVLVTVGRRPRTTGWGLAAMAVDLDARGFVAIDAQCRTSMAGVFAIGDLTGEPMLAHRASAQGEMVAEIIAGHRRSFAPAAIPAVCFTDPEIVTVGDHAATGPHIKTAQFPLAANGRALTMEADHEGGFIRVTADARDHRLLGFAAVGRGVSELSGEMTALVEMGAVLEDVAGIIHAHPTLSEALGEGALRSLGRAIHV